MLGSGPWESVPRGSVAMVALVSSCTGMGWTLG